MVRVVAVSHHSPLRYLSVSKGGQLTVWSSSLHIHKTLRVSERFEQSYSTLTHTYTHI